MKRSVFSRTGSVRHELEAWISIVVAFAAFAAACPSRADVAWFFCYPVSPIGAAGSTDRIECSVSPIGAPDPSVHYNNTQGFLEYNSAFDEYHLGDDWNGSQGGNGDLGSPLYAVADGTVVYVNDLASPAGDPHEWGRVLIIEHELPDGELVYSLYAHVDEFNVPTACHLASAPGCDVADGQQVATLGDGNGHYACDPPPACAHLHFEIRKSFEYWDPDIIPGSGYIESPTDPFVEEHYYDPTEFIEARRGGQCTPLTEKGTCGADGPDLIVINPILDDSTLDPNQAFSTTVVTRNQGDQISDPTTVRFMISEDPVITTSDTEMSGDPVGALAPQAVEGDSDTNNAPTANGAYWVGACVDPVVGEANIANNCSVGIPIVVGGGGASEIVELVDNGGFEDGSTSWSTDGDFHIGDQPCPHSGNRYAFLAEQNGNWGDGLTGTLSQLVTIPANATSVDLSYEWSISTNDPSAEIRDGMVVSIYEADCSTAHQVVEIYSNLDAQNGCGTSYYDTEGPFDLLAYAGETICLSFFAGTDATPNTETVFRVDDVSIEAEVPTGGPPSVVTDGPSLVTESTVRLHFSANPNGLETEVWFDLEADDPDPEGDTDRINVGAGTGSIELFIDEGDLDCDTQYFYKANAENSAGNDEGSTQSFFTDECVGGPPIADTDSAREITATSAELRGDIFPNGLATTAFYRWGPTLDLDNSTSPQNMGSGTEWVDFPQPLPGLVCETQYYYQAFAQNSAGTSSGTTNEFSTLECPNQPPLATNDQYGAVENTVLSVSTASGVLANDTDPDGDPLEAVLVDSTNQGVIDLAEDGSFSYTPFPDFTGIDMFTYQAFDGTAFSSSATVTITVEPSTNELPFISVVEPDGVEDNTDSLFQITWIDGDVDDDSDISLSYSEYPSCFGATEIVSGISEDDPVDSYVWNAADVPEGAYWILGTIDDGVNPPQSACSSGYVLVSSCDTWFEGGPYAGDVALLRANPVTGVAFAATTLLYRSRDWGESWSKLPLGDTNRQIGSIAFDSTRPARVWVTWGDFLFRSEDEGDSWQVVLESSGYLSGLVVRPPNQIFAIKSGRDILWSSDDGSSWTDLSELPSFGEQLASSTADVLWAGTFDGVFRSVDNGVTWADGGLDDVRALAAHPTDNLVALASVGSQGVLFRTEDGGVSWKEVADGYAYDISWGIDNTDLVIVGTGGVGYLLTSTDAGVSWSEEFVGADPLSSVALDPNSMSDPGVLVYGIRRRPQGLTAWLPGHEGLSRPNNLVVPLERSVIALGTAPHSRQHVAFSESAASSWKSSGPFIVFDLLEVVSFAPSSLLASYYDRTFRSEDGGDSWTQTAGVGLPPWGDNALAASLTGSVYLASWEGVLVSSDAGDSWQNISGNLPEGERVFDVAVDPVDPSTIYVVLGLTRDRVFKTTDGGVLWSEISPSPTIRSARVKVLDDQSVFVFSVPGSVFRSVDQGGSWTLLWLGDTSQTPRDIVRSVGTTGEYILGTSDGLYRTYDDGATWFAFDLGSPVVPEVPSLAFDRSSPHLLYAGTSAGVFRTWLCTAELESEIFSDGFESGDTSMWN